MSTFFGKKQPPWQSRMEGYYEIGAVEFYKICLCYLRSNMKFCSVTHVLNPNLKKVITIFLSGRVFFVLQRDSNILRLKCDGTRAETMFRLAAKRTSPFKSAGGRQFSRLLAAEVCASAVVMLDTPCSEVVWRVLATHSIRQFPPSLHFPSRASTYAITFQLDSTWNTTGARNVKLCEKVCHKHICKFFAK